MNGMFALAIWDRKEKKLTLVRDRFGIKPLYFHHNECKLIFASEIRPILDHVKFSLNHTKLYDFLTLRYIPSSSTLFKGIECLRPAHYMVIDRDGHTQSTRYWMLEDSEKKQKLCPDHLYDLLYSSVKYRLRSDVPVGSFLSGGIDSASITECVRAHGQKVDTFCFDVQGSLSEVNQAKEVASLNGHRFHVVKESNFDNLEKILWFLEEPIGDSIILPTYSLADGASRKVKSVLSGEGADEVFNGYVHHIILYRLNNFKSLSKIASALFKKIFPITSLNKFHPYSQDLDQLSLKKVLNDIQSFDGTMTSCRNFIRMFSPEELKTYVNPDIIETANPLLVHPQSQSQSQFLNSLTKMDLYDWNSKYTLHRLDRLTMAHSLEARVPFLDHRLVEYVFNLRDTDRLGLFSQKKALRRAMKKSHLPKILRKRKKKAFHLPLQDRYQIPFQKKLEQIFLDEPSIRQSEIWNFEGISRLVKKATARSFIEDKKLFCLLVLELWQRMFSTEKWRHT